MRKQLAGREEPSEQNQTAFFLVLDLYWRPPEFGGLWYKARQFNKTICSTRWDKVRKQLAGRDEQVLLLGCELYKVPHSYD